MPGEAERVAPFTPDEFLSLFGLRWSNADLRSRLAPLGFGEALPQVRTERVADFLRRAKRDERLDDKLASRRLGRSVLRVVGQRVIILKA